MIFEKVNRYIKIIMQRKSKRDNNSAEITNILEKVNNIPLDLLERLDRIQNDIEFIKNHNSSYLGNSTGLTHLIDETPIYINTNDIGCPANFINGGKYEESHFHILASFRKPDSNFLDIGANLGVFSLKMAHMLSSGKAFAFEPNPNINKLLFQSIHLNGLRNKVNLLKYGASDNDGELRFAVPNVHAGGASIVSDEHEVSEQSETYTISVRKIDNLLQDLNQFDIAKIDVEGHEFKVLVGMEQLILRSPNAAIIFEKLGVNTGIEKDIFNFIQRIGLILYRLEGLQLSRIDIDEFTAIRGYFFAAREQTVGKDLNRNFLQIYPNDLKIVTGNTKNTTLNVNESFAERTLIFYGPYWYLCRGTYKVTINADILGELSFTLAERFGYPLKEFVVNKDLKSFIFFAKRDLIKFEIICRSKSQVVQLSLESIRLTKVG